MKTFSTWCRAIWSVLFFRTRKLTWVIRRGDEEIVITLRSRWRNSAYMVEMSARSWRWPDCWEIVSGPDVAGLPKDAPGSSPAPWLDADPPIMGSPRWMASP